MALLIAPEILTRWKLVIAHFTTHKLPGPRSTLRFTGRLPVTRLCTMNLATAFAATAAREAKKTAVFWGEQEHSYERLLAQSRQVAAHLQQPLGVKPGDRVALWLKNCPQFISALFGVFQAGAVVVPINNFLKPEEVHDILADAGIDVILTDATLAEHLPALRSLRPQLRVWNLEELASPEGRHAGSPVNPKPKCQHPAVEDLAVIIYTSGTTGRPKGAMLTHANLLHNVESCRQVLAAADYDRFVVLLPMFHSFMLCVGVLLPLLVGGSLVLVRSLHPPKNVLQEIYQRRATILPAVPSLFRTLAGAPIPPGLPLRICISGGAPLPVEILREFNRHVPVPLIEGYGLSEASPVVSMNPLSGPWKEGSIGKPIPDVEMSVQDDAGSLLPIGATGEICVRGGNVMRGYWNQPEATAKTLRRGWLLTGDIGPGCSPGTSAIATPMVISTLPIARKTCSSSMASTSIRVKSRRSSTRFLESKKRPWSECPTRAAANNRWLSLPPRRAPRSTNAASFCCSARSWPITKCPGESTSCPLCRATPPARC